MENIFSDEFKTLFTPFFNQLYETLPLARVTFEKEDEHGIIEFILPGFEKDNFSLTLQNNRKLIVEYNKPNDSENEWDFSFKKVYSISFDIDSKNVRVGFVNGIFSIEFNGIDADIISVDLPMG